MQKKSHIEIYKMSLARNLKSSYIIFLMIFVLVILHIHAVNNYQYYNYKSFLLVLVISLPMLGPSIFVHFEYMWLNWKTKLTIDKANKTLRYEDRDKHIEVSFDEIAKVIKHQTKKSALLGDTYDYYEIYLKNGEILIITSLMARDLKIPGIEIEIVDRYFPSVYFSERVFGK